MTYLVCEVELKKKEKKRDVDSTSGYRAYGLMIMLYVYICYKACVGRVTWPLFGDHVASTK